jgi:polyhydroxybutyrate depolymerase
MRSISFLTRAMMEKGRWIMGMSSVIATFVLCGYCGSQAAVDSYEPGTHKFKLDQRVMGFRRSYLIHIPKNYDQAKARPLVVALHGAFSTAKEMEEWTGLSELADQEGFLVLYPNGITLFGWLQHWNAGHCCGRAMQNGVDDLGFVSRVIDEVRERFNVDSSRIYMVGHSNGGMLVHLFAAQKPETLAAVVVIAGTIGSRPSPSEPEVRIPHARGPVPIMAIHGREDDSVPYEGNRLRNNGPLYVSVKESMEFWLEANQNSSAPQREVMMAGRVIKDTWKAPKIDQEVILLTLEGWKHDLPTKNFTKKLPGNDPLKDFHATDMIWDFFKSHPR